MSEPKRQHPAAALAKAFETIKSHFITFIIIIFVGSSDQDGFMLYWILGSVVVLLIWGIINWLRFTYAIEDGELRIEQGVITRNKIFLGADRIQVIDISAGIIQQMFNLVSVEVKTAGSTSKQAKIDAVSRGEAERIKQALRYDKVEDSTEDEGKKNANRSAVYELSTRDLIIAATTSGRLGLMFSLIAAAYSQLDQFVPEDRLIGYVQNSWPEFASVTVIVLSALFLLALAWLLSFVYTIIKYYNFYVEVRDDELLISRGLFERIQLTIPFNRIQAVQIKQELLRQPLGYASLAIESAGYGEEKGNSRTLFPLIAKDRMYQFIKEVIPDYYAPDYAEVSQSLPRVSLRRYILRKIWIVLLPILLAWLLIPYGYYAVLILIPAIYLGYMQYQDAGLRCDKDTIILNSRLLSKKTAIVKKHRVQSLQLHQNPFQTRLRLGNVSLYVASGNTGRSFKVRELSVSSLKKYWDWLSEEKEAEEFEGDQGVKNEHSGS